MAKHRKYELLNHVVQAINECGWEVLYLEDISEHPFVLKIYNGKESYRLRIYVWNTTPGGKNRPLDEYRIQNTGVIQFQRFVGEKTLILGWWEEVGVFTGYDYNEYKDKIYHPKSSDSFQIKEANLRKAPFTGFSPYQMHTGAISVAFRPDFFVNYVQNLEEIHSIGTSAKDFEILKEVSDAPLELNTALIENIGNQQRQTMLVEITKKLRDPSFESRVLRAYSNKCAFSGMQLQLLDAAHILPVAISQSTDLTANGIALSALYHRAYDRGLVTFNERYRIIVNKRKLESLKDIGFHGGTEQFLNGLQTIISVPGVINDRPNVNFIREANKLRGW